MAHVNSDIASFNMDDESGSVVDISGSVNSVSINGGQNLLDDTGLGDSRHTVIEGLANASEVAINGFLNSTTEAIFSPLVDGTSITKSISAGLVSGQYLTGEAWPANVTLGQSVDAVGTFSCTFQAQNGLSRTSQQIT